MFWNTPKTNLILGGQDNFFNVLNVSSKFDQSDLQKMLVEVFWPDLRRNTNSWVLWALQYFFPALADWSECNCPNFICSGALTVRVSDNRGFGVVGHIGSHIGGHIVYHLTTLRCCWWPLGGVGGGGHLGGHLEFHCRPSWRPSWISAWTFITTLIIHFVRIRADIGSQIGPWFCTELNSVCFLQIKLPRFDSLNFGLELRLSGWNLFSPEIILAFAGVRY